LFIDKYHWTHEEYMNAPREIVEVILLKRASDAKAQKKQQRNLALKRR
jgi:hypothetical protein